MGHQGGDQLGPDPVLLGVHPAARDDGGQAPMYVSRDVDDRVDAAVRAGGFVLLSGESTAGKTRVAYEAMRRVLPDHHHLVAPGSREAVRTVVETVVDHRRCVVWLEDVERFFGVHGLTVPLLDRMLAADAVVIGTIRIGELDRFGARHEADSDDRDGWRTAREASGMNAPISRSCTCLGCAECRPMGVEGLWSLRSVGSPTRVVACSGCL